MEYAFIRRAFLASLRFGRSPAFIGCLILSKAPREAGRWHGLQAHRLRTRPRGGDSGGLCLCPLLSLPSLLPKPHHLGRYTLCCE